MFLHDWNWMVLPSVHDFFKFRSTISLFRSIIFLQPHCRLLCSLNGQNCTAAFLFFIFLGCSLCSCTSVKTTPEKSGMTWVILAGQIISFLQTGSRVSLKGSAFCYRGKKKQLALIPIVCLHQSTCVCWPSNMMSLLIPCSPLTGSRGEPFPHSRDFLSCCIVEYVHFILEDQLDFFKVFLQLFIFF